MRECNANATRPTIVQLFGMSERHYEHLQNNAHFEIRLVQRSVKLWKLLNYAYLNAKIGVDTAQNEPSKVGVMDLSRSQNHDAIGHSPPAQPAQPSMVGRGGPRSSIHRSARLLACKNIEEEDAHRQGRTSSGGRTFCRQWKNQNQVASQDEAPTVGVHMWKLNPWGGLKLTKIKELWRARSRLYRSRLLQPNTHFAAFFEIRFYKILKPLHRSKLNFKKPFWQPFL